MQHCRSSDELRSLSSHSEPTLTRGPTVLTPGDRAGDGPLRGVTIAALIFSAISLVTFFLGVYPGIAGVVGIIATVSMLVVQGRPGQGQRTSYQVVAGLLIASGVLHAIAAGFYIYLWAVVYVYGGEVVCRGPADPLPASSPPCDSLVSL